MWYIGQEIVYITGIAMPKDSVHTIKRLFKFPCGCLYLDIGVTLKGRNFTQSSCSKHGSVIPYVGCDHWNSTSFRPLLTDSIRFAEETLHKISTHIEIEIEQFILN